jgi:hypothetical protein
LAFGCSQAVSSAASVEPVLDLSEGFARATKPFISPRHIIFVSPTVDIVDIEAIFLLLSTKRLRGEVTCPGVMVDLEEPLDSAASRGFESTEIP